VAAYASVVWKSAWAVNYNRKTSPVGTRSTIPNSHVPYGCGGGALVTKVVRSKATSAGTAPGRARAGYLVRSIKVSTACITEVCGLRKQ